MLRGYPYDRLKPAYRFVARWYAASRLALLRLKYGGRPVPLRDLLKVRSSIILRHAVNPMARYTIRQGSALAHPVLRRAFADECLGNATLGVQTINYLEDEIRRLKPGLILECGSGISTVCLARFLADLSDTGEMPRLIALEESPEYWSRTTGLLRAMGLSCQATVIYAPLAAVKIDGELLEVYSVGPKALSEVVGSRRASFLLVDGPSGGGLRRYAALRLLLPYLREGTRLYLDDALRDWELAVVRRWIYEGYVVPEGTYLFDKGLFVGRVRRDTTSEDGTQREI